MHTTHILQRARACLAVITVAATTMATGCAERTVAPSAVPVPRSVQMADGARRITITDLGALPGSDWSEAWGINDRGQIVGASRVGAEMRAVLWHDGIMTDLGTLPTGGSCTARAINDRGLIVGYCGARAFRWERGKMVDIGTLPGGTYSVAFDIGPSGDIVGYTDARVATRAFRWERGVMADLGVLTWGSSAASGINARGDMVGHIITDEHRATAWIDGKVIDLGVLPGARSSVAQAINVKRQIVGNSGGAAVLWDDGGMTMLGALPGANWSWAFDINAAGRIVGVSQDPGPGEAFLRPTVWENGGLVELNRLGDGSASASGVNTRGDVVGWSAVDGGGRHAVLWTIR
jgi:probable HAF family extracellular repeat protein